MLPCGKEDQHHLGLNEEACQACEMFLLVYLEMTAHTYTAVPNSGYKRVMDIL